MATCRQIIRRAMRLIQALPSGVTPSTQQNTDALEGLQAVILGNPSIGIAGRFFETDLDTTPYTPGEFERVRLTDPLLSTSVTLPATIVDYSNTNTWSRPPVNGALVHLIATLSGSPYNKLFAYIASKAAWVELTNLTLDTENPLGAEFDDALAFLTAVRIAPEFGVQPTEQVVLDAARARSQIAHTFRGRREIDFDCPYPFRDYA